MSAPPIYTTEPMMTRALAAEIRHDPRAITALLESRMGLQAGALGQLQTVSCEKGARLDVLLEYRSQNTVQYVGIEAKIDHEITSEQLVAERAHVDHLVLLVLAAVDAGVHASKVDAVLTWAETLACFQDSRLRQEDIDARPFSKMAAFRLLRQNDMHGLRQLLPGWTIDAENGSGGMPALELHSPRLPDGRELCGQIQVDGRGMPASMDQVRFEYHIGIGINRARLAEEYPDPKRAKHAPGWIPHLQTLGTVLEAPGRTETYLTRHSGSNGREANEGEGGGRIDLIKKFLGSSSGWLARGYYNWALGVKSSKVTADELPLLCKEAATIFADWYDAECAQPQG
ncbi:hypothetical protein M3B61_10795 [Micrococcus luteus]|nr:hypothetical protein [Micrococcus luteus]MCV7584353.1 hypothetical protein [Micrococcus luteus]MCV7589048.1 hypothetical protein [Micrococcus luteus]